MILKPEQLSEEARHEATEKVMLTPHGELPSFPLVRHITPLVLVALQRANNPYITGRKGFEVIGITFDEDNDLQSTDRMSFAIAIMPKTAEVLLLLSCTREELKRFATHPEELESRAQDIVEESTKEFMAQATVIISEELQAVSGSKANIADEKPTVEAIEVDEKKKQDPTG